MFRSKLNQRPPSTVAIKRVLRQGGLYICGVCRKTYGREADADSCLARCLHAHVNPKAPVAVVAGGTGKQFRCHFCKRVHSEREAAQRCAAACREKTQATIAAEHAHHGLAAPAGSPAGQAKTTASPTPRPAAKPVRRDQMHKFLREGRRLICRKCGAEAKDLDTVIACYDSHPVKEAHGGKRQAPAAQAQAVKKADADKGTTPKEAPVPAPAAAVPAAAATTSTPKSSTDDADKFFRDGARYVCRGCQKKVFTRGEVIQCFDAHAAGQAG